MNDKKQELPKVANPPLSDLLSLKFTTIIDGDESTLPEMRKVVLTENANGRFRVQTRYYKERDKGNKAYFSQECKRNGLAIKWAYLPER